MRTGQDFKSKQLQSGTICNCKDLKSHQVRIGGFEITSDPH